MKVLPLLGEDSQTAASTAAAPAAAADKGKGDGDRVGVLFAVRIAANCGCRSRYQALVSVIEESVGDRVDYIAGIKWECEIAAHSGLRCSLPVSGAQHPSHRPPAVTKTGPSDS
ncbi:hypothetical protein PR003_g34889 [Phytophthora rubi]|uniref:Uncharacterized protein n=1 Tax=Phytophthora rubi TaxID=129364 RepID=A0A6A4AIX1_9STRA|nr:hypothetical protein PR003_g34889 [Phytophthora rubi]